MITFAKFVKMWYGKQNRALIVINYFAQNVLTIGLKIKKLVQTAVIPSVVEKSKGL